VIELLDGSIFGEPLASATEAFAGETGALIPLENALTERSTRTCSQTRPAPTRGQRRNHVEFLEAEIDFRNAANALRLAHGGPTRSGELPHRGRRPVQRVGAKPTHRRLRRARRSHRRKRPLRRPVSDALSRLREADSLIQFEHAPDAALLEYADTLSSIYPTSVSAVLSYILAKEREVENIRAIARGREVGFPRTKSKRSW